MFVETAETTELERPVETDAVTRRRAIIEKVIEDIRPNLTRDGGDCQLVDVVGNKVMVRLSGACVFCKLSSMTLEGIQSRLVEETGEFIRVIPVMGGVMPNL